MSSEAWSCTGDKPVIIANAERIGKPMKSPRLRKDYRDRKSRELRQVHGAKSDKHHIAITEESVHQSTQRASLETGILIQRPEMTAIAAAARANSTVCTTIALRMASLLTEGMYSSADFAALFSRISF